MTNKPTKTESATMVVSESRLKSERRKKKLAKLTKRATNAITIGSIDDHYDEQLVEAAADNGEDNKAMWDDANELYKFATSSLDSFKGIMLLGYSTIVKTAEIGPMYDEKRNDLLNACNALKDDVKEYETKLVTEYSTASTRKGEVDLDEYHVYISAYESLYEMINNMQGVLTPNAVDIQLTIKELHDATKRESDHANG